MAEFQQSFAAVGNKDHTPPDWMIFGKLRIMTFCSGAKQGKAIPIAVTNPIDIDLKADEFRAKGDLLAESTPLDWQTIAWAGAPTTGPSSCGMHSGALVAQAVATSRSDWRSSSRSTDSSKHAIP
ncbi:MAG: hypothetical protein GY768_04855 [Planctomycetaceae bacterium]|nr:hypothetical protein [Planctomycetaceae bacterium]